MMKMQFMAGTGRKYDGVNYVIGESDCLTIYAEVEYTEGSEDYGYLTLKKAVEKALQKHGISEELTWQYDGQEQFLDKDAAVECDVYVEIDTDEDLIREVI